ncbi:hypothetical protein D910_08828 [Dendroctonus ponderosae]
MAFIQFAVVFALLASLGLTQAELKNTGGHQIIDGNCTDISRSDRVYFHQVDKMAFPFFIRSETDTYYGDRSISCIMAINEKDISTGGTVIITSGGVGHSYVTMQFKSYRSHGLDFSVSVYSNTEAYFNDNP